MRSILTTVGTSLLTNAKRYLNRADVRRLFDRALTKLRVRVLRISGADRVRNCDCLVYPKGHRDERMFFFEAEDGSVCVCALGRHSDRSYEQLIARGVRRENYTNFQAWTTAAAS